MTEPARQSCLHHTPQKRSSSTASLTTPSPKRRREAHDTPTRYALQRMHPGTSPAVAVSSMSRWSILLDSPFIKIGTLTQFMHYTSQVLVKGKTDSRTHPIPRSSGLKTLARSVGRQNRPSIARQAMRDPKIKKMVLNIICTRSWQRCPLKGPILVFIRDTWKLWTAFHGTVSSPNYSWMLQHFTVFFKDVSVSSDGSGWWRKEEERGLLYTHIVQATRQSLVIVQHCCWDIVITTWM